MYFSRIELIFGLWVIRLWVILIMFWCSVLLLSLLILVWMLLLNVVYFFILVMVSGIFGEILVLVRWLGFR